MRYAAHCRADAVSQFTLYAKTAKGTKPDFHRAMGGEACQPFYEAFLARMREAYAAERIKGKWVPHDRWAIRRHDGRRLGQRRYVNRLMQAL